MTKIAVGKRNKGRGEAAVVAVEIYLLCGGGLYVTETVAIFLFVFKVLYKNITA